MIGWKALTGRLSVFSPMPSQDVAALALPLFQEVWGSQPDQFNRPANPLQPTIAQGRLGAVSVRISSQPTRIDMNFGPTESQADPLDTNVNLIEDSNEFHKCLSSFNKASGFIAERTPVVRIACAAQFVRLRDSIAECNADLAHVLPDSFQLNLGETEDVSIQLNYPRMSKYKPSLKVNRLGVWSTQKFQIMLLDIVAGLGGKTQPASESLPRMISEHLAASVLVEINNVQTNAPLDKGDTVAITDEFVDELQTYRTSLGIDIDVN